MRKTINLNIVCFLSRLGCPVSHRPCCSVSGTRQGSVRQLSGENRGARSAEKVFFLSVSRIPLRALVPPSTLFNNVTCKLLVSPRSPERARATPRRTQGVEGGFSGAVRKPDVPLPGDAEASTCSGCSGASRLRT